MDFKTRKGLKIAVIGSGISGLCAAYLLQDRHRVTLLEKNSYFGGHTHTVVIPEGPDRGLPVDTGFIVLNQATYPNFIRFLERLGVEKCLTDMSFSYYCETSGRYYSSNGLDGFFVQRSNLLKPRFLRFVFEVIQYLGSLRKAYLSGTLPDVTLAEYVRRRGLHPEVMEWFIIPMAAAIWSGSELQMGQFPVRTFAQFYENHGLLRLYGHPPWYYVKGGSHTYVNAFFASFRGKAFKNSPVIGVSRTGPGIRVRFKAADPQFFDAVVIATHADQALQLLEDPDPDEKRLLGAWSYSRNNTFLHTDAGVMPPDPRAWASWNYRREAGADSGAPVTVSYDMNRLQNLRADQNYFITLNPRKPLKPDHIIKEMTYTHPQYSFKAFESQKALPGLNGRRNTFFCGAYFGYGFHEDGVKSALGAAEQFGVAL